MPNHKFKVIFLLQRPEAWINYESVWKSLSNSNDFELKLIALPYNMSDPEQSERMAPIMRSKLLDVGIPFTEWAPGMQLTKDQYNVAVFGHPYDRERPKEFWFNEVRKSISKIVYIPYGISMGAGKKNLLLQFSQPVQMYSDAVIARSEFEKSQYKYHCPTGNNHVYVLGYPRFDRTLNNLSKENYIEIEEFRNGRVMLFWNSHFSFGPQHSQVSNFSTFDIIAPEIFKATQKRRNRFCLLWRPHPGLIPELIRLGMLSEENLEKLYSELKTIGVYLDRSIEYSAAFSMSDAMATDIGSFLLEYLTQHKPIISLINPEGEPPNSEANILISSYYSAKSANEVINFIDELIQGRCEPPSVDLQRKHLPRLDGLSGNRVANLISQLAGSKTITIPQEFSQDQHKHSKHELISGNSLLVEPVFTPILDELCYKILDLRRIKSTESKIKKKMRRLIKSIRADAVEAIKRTNTLMTLLQQEKRTK